MYTPYPSEMPLIRIHARPTLSICQCSLTSRISKLRQTNKMYPLTSIMRTIIVTVNLNTETKPAGAQSPRAVPSRVTSEALLGLKRELVIVHNGREYRLRLTQNGKLILTA